jgi:hypothetical protein
LVLGVDQVDVEPMEDGGHGDLELEIGQVTADTSTANRVREKAKRDEGKTHPPVLKGRLNLFKAGSCFSSVQRSGLNS